MLFQDRFPAGAGEELLFEFLADFLLEFLFDRS